VSMLQPEGWHVN